jgi:hypothetical protein
MGDEKDCESEEFARPSLSTSSLIYFLHSFVPLQIVFLLAWNTIFFKVGNVRGQVRKGC